MKWVTLATQAPGFPSLERMTVDEGTLLRTSYWGNVINETRALIAQQVTFIANDPFNAQMNLFNEQMSLFNKQMEVLLELMKEIASKMPAPKK